jgi:hypothetical protein
MILNKNNQFSRLSLQQSHHPSIFDAPLPIQKSSRKKPVVTIEVQSPRVNQTIDISKDSEEISDIKGNQNEDINHLKVATKELSQQLSNLKL